MGHDDQAGLVEFEIGGTASTTAFFISLVCPGAKVPMAEISKHHFKGWQLHFRAEARYLDKEVGYPALRAFAEGQLAVLKVTDRLMK